MQMTQVVLKKRVCLLVALVLFLSVVGFSQTEGMRIRVKVRRANVHEQPSKEGEIIAVVRRGRIFQVDGKEGEWYLIRLPLKLEGFVLPGYIHESAVEVVGQELPQTKIRIQEKKLEEKPRRFGAGLIIGVSFPADDYYNSGAYINANFSVKTVEEFTLELSIQGFDVGVDDSFEDGGLSGGDLRIIPIQLSLKKYFSFQSNTLAYFSGGIGYYLNSFTLGDPSFDREETVKSNLGYHLGAGIEYNFKGNLALVLEVKYFFMSADGTWSYTDPVDGPVSGQFDNLKMDTALFGIGISYQF
ncbi:MAG: outer membrane beta-barrel protein [Candidatus Aminicenantes bacterium]|nr:MAG: outer membrane beta-barrel protein [Candidatus Aminicenantes bacterium]